MKSMVYKIKIKIGDEIATFKLWNTKIEFKLNLALFGMPFFYFGLFYLIVYLQFIKTEHFLNWTVFLSRIISTGKTITSKEKK